MYKRISKAKKKAAEFMNVFEYSKQQCLLCYPRSEYIDGIQSTFSFITNLTTSESLSVDFPVIRNLITHNVINDVYHIYHSDALVIF